VSLDVIISSVLDIFGWATGRASRLEKFLLQQFPKVYFWEARHDLEQLWKH